MGWDFFYQHSKSVLRLKYAKKALTWFFNHLSDFQNLKIQTMHWFLFLKKVADIREAQWVSLA